LNFTYIELAKLNIKQLLPLYLYSIKKYDWYLYSSTLLVLIGPKKTV